MNRRIFIIKTCWITLGIGAMTAGISLKACPRILTGPGPGSLDALEDFQKDRLAFLETVYPFFSISQLSRIMEIVDRPASQWEVINQTFFIYYNKLDNDEHFYHFPVEQREIIIVEYLKSADKDEAQKFDTSRIRITRNAVENGFFPYASFGYPDVRTEPFIADPSWEICDQKPFHNISP